MKESQISRRCKTIVPFYVMDLLARAKALEAEGRSIIHMEVGEPDFVTPPPVIEAGKQALDSGRTGYTPATGIPELRHAVAEYYQTRYNISVPASRIIITPGASGALQLILAALINPGDELLLTDPGYPCNKNFVEFFSGVPVAVSVGPDSEYQLNSAMLEQHWSERTCGALVATPSNPTGTIVPKVEMAAIHETVTRRGGSLIVDEIYQGLIYDNPGYSALEISDEVMVINSFSKYFGMTGWRLGWLVVPEQFVDSIDCLAQNIFLSCSAPAQYAALASFRPENIEILEARRQEFKARRDFLLPALRELGFDIPVSPQGAFYLYANCANLTDDSFAFCYELLEAEGVAVTPGKDFGVNEPEHHLRFAYTTRIEVMEEAVNRIRRFLSR
ncbi:MAG: pyridoxal phosphate-dependent aminotransferase [Desulfobulbaceae bacterium]|nr:MAG: pyridoxal phosphate-dependent aminotransferase [Desulfobulbaceae bacterium]